EAARTRPELPLQAIASPNALRTRELGRALRARRTVQRSGTITKRLRKNCRNFLHRDRPRNFLRPILRLSASFPRYNTGRRTFVFKGRRPTSGAILSTDGTGSGFGLALTYRHEPIDHRRG